MQIKHQHAVRSGELLWCASERFPLLIICKHYGFAIAKRWERFSLSAFGRGGGAKWEEGRGEVLRFTVSSKTLANTDRGNFLDAHALMHHSLRLTGIKVIGIVAR